MMRVLHILDHSLPLHSGYSFRSAEIIRAQRLLGWKVDALTGPKHNAEMADDAEVAEPGCFRSAFSTRDQAMPSIVRQVAVVRILQKRILDLVERHGYDLLHAHSPSLDGLAALGASRRLKLPVVYEMRASWEDAAVDHGTSRRNGIRYRLTRYSETNVFRRADRITTICEGLKAEICSRGIAEGRVTVVPNGVDVDRFEPMPNERNEMRRKRGVEDRFVLVFCGSFYNYEGLDLLLEAVAAAVSECPKLLVCLAGGGQEEMSLKQRVVNMNLQQHIEFLGRVPQSEVVSLYNLADACVFPRYRMKLTEMVTPLKPLEAMSTGSVVLASDVGGHRELIQYGVTGFLFEADSVDALTKKILDLWRNDCRGEAGLAARRYVVEHRTWKSNVDRYRTVYSEAMRTDKQG